MTGAQRLRPNLHSAHRAIWSTITLHVAKGRFQQTHSCQKRAFRFVSGCEMAVLTRLLPGVARRLPLEYVAISCGARRCLRALSFLLLLVR